jgi:hypothetical protein
MCMIKYPGGPTRNKGTDIYVRVSSYSYSKVDAVEQRDMVNSGVRGTKNRNLRTEVNCTSTVSYLLSTLSYSST